MPWRNSDISILKKLVKERILDLKEDRSRARLVEDICEEFGVDVLDETEEAKMNLIKLEEYVVNFLVLNTYGPEYLGEEYQRRFRQQEAA